MIQKALRGYQRKTRLDDRRNALRKKRAGWVSKIQELNAKMGEASESEAQAMQAEIMTLMMHLDATARDSYVRIKRICSITSRPRGITKFGISRNCVYLRSGFGQMSGVKKV